MDAKTHKNQNIVNTILTALPAVVSAFKIMCLSPLTLKRNIRSMNGDFTNIVPCGKCVLCLKRRQNSWSFRLYQESKQSISACFITLTYETPPLTQNQLPTLYKRDYQNFLKRLRKQFKSSNTLNKIKYYACGEYGTQTKRPHYHAILFNLPSNYLVDSDILSTTWGHGHIDISPCNIATIKYVTKYVMKGRFEPKHDVETGLIDDRLPEFSLMSKKMGLNHLTPQMVKYYLDNMISHVTLPGGTLTSLPRYFRDKIFSKTERLELNKLAEEIRNANFHKLFNNDYKHEFEWKKDQIRKQEKAIILERQKI